VRNPRECDTIWSCSQMLPAGTVELKSSISEVGRAFYKRRQLIFTNGTGPKHMTALYKVYLPKKMRRVAREAFSDWPKFPPPRGQHQGDLFYWQHRLSAWQGLAFQDYNLSHKAIS